MAVKASLHVDFQQPTELVFNRARLRRAFVRIGQIHMRDARRLVMHRGRSEPGITRPSEPAALRALSVTTSREPQSGARA